MYTYLKPREHYEDRYDRLTVEFARQDMKYFNQFYEKWFKIMPDEKPDSIRSVFHLNGVYMQMVGNGLLDRYDKRDSEISEMMTEDEDKDEKLANARLTAEPVCQHCGKTDLKITDKSLLNKDGLDSQEAVLFFLKCAKCGKNSAYWEDGEAWEPHKTYCPKCKAEMTDKRNMRGEVLTTTYKCQACGHSYKDKLDLKPKKEKLDPDYETDRQLYCLHDKKNLDEHRDAKWRYDNLGRMSKELKEKEENKELYDAVAKLRKPKIAELADMLKDALDKAGYIKFSLDKPEIGRNVKVSFSCLDDKSDREDYESRKTLQKLLRQTLADTNWRLTSDGISYRLGYLSGQLRAYESEDDMLGFIKKSN